LYILKIQTTFVKFITEAKDFCVFFDVQYKLEEEFFCIELLEKPLTGFDQRLDRGDFDVFFNSDDL